MPKTDFVGDEGLTYLLLLKEAGALPAYVEEIPEAEDLEGIPSVAFADSANRLFPIHDKTSAFLSAVHAFKEGATESSDPWIGRLKVACIAHNIEEDVKAAHAALAAEEEPEKQASEAPEKPFALDLVVTPGGPVQHFYPIGSAHEIEESARKMASDLRDAKLPLAWMADASEKLVKAASSIGLSEKRIPQSIRRIGRPMTPDRKVLENEITKRAAAGVEGPFLDIYKQAAEGALGGDMPVTDGALVWQTADRKLGIADKFAGDNDPLWAFKSGHTEEYIAQVKEAHFMLGDVLIPKSALDAVDDRDMAMQLAVEDARPALLAKSASSGTEATRILNGLSENGIKKLSCLILENTPEHATA